MMSGYISLPDAARFFEISGGNRPHVKTIGRWCVRGSHGVILKSRIINNRRVTSEIWIQEFIEACSNRRPVPCPAADEPNPEFEASHARAMETLRRVYGYGSKNIGKAAEGESPDLRPSNDRGEAGELHQLLPRALPDDEIGRDDFRGIGGEGSSFAIEAGSEACHKSSDQAGASRSREAVAH